MIMSLVNLLLGKSCFSIHLMLGYHNVLLNLTGGRGHQEAEANGHDAEERRGEKDY